MKLLRYDEQFPEDLGAAINWYTQYSVELANRFRDRVRKCIDSIQLLPESFPLLEDTLPKGTQRSAMLRGFPWMVVYSEESEVILIVRIIHTASNWSL